MVSLPGGFWSGWVVVLTLVSLTALVWLFVSVYFPSKKSLQSSHGEEEPVWDGDLREGSQAPPLWWFWLFFSILIFSVGYLILFPGLGSYPGLLKWSQDARLESSYTQYDARFAASRARILAADLASLKEDAALMASADRVFQGHCAACHGSDAKGQAAQFPNLVDSDWQWGGSPAAVEQTIRQGRVAVMPAWLPALGKEGTLELAAYVKQLGKSGREARAGHGKYTAMCSACHGADGLGNQALGAPNLTDLTWLYGHSVESIGVSIAAGRSGQMPAFEGRLDDVQIKLLVARFAQ